MCGDMLSLWRVVFGAFRSIYRRRGLPSVARPWGVGSGTSGFARPGLHLFIIKKERPVEETRSYVVYGDLRGPQGPCNDKA